ncbi:LIM/homeobox protein Awh-like isoform X2 [Ptychodera flava]|uniref:LIM/homeobox protein Awh-like isoform X2 n=1 Tax=Ptychodera flava TaxID=63121 RepID=UPI00396A02FE
MTLASLSLNVHRSLRPIRPKTVADWTVFPEAPDMSEQASNDSFEEQMIDSEVCIGCTAPIVDRYLLKVGTRSWHVRCLRCCVCQTNLGGQQSCFTKDENIYCKMDYIRQFGTKCAHCMRNIQSNDWVRKAKNHVYHLACFACDNCKRQLSTGEEFAMQENKVLCKTHYLELLENSSDTSETKEENGHGRHNPRTKRVRTTFTEEQLQVLQANFNVDSNPDGQDLERIAQITGLSKRVTQVWFQNSRARQKKHNTGKTTPGPLDNNNKIGYVDHSPELLKSPSNPPPCQKCGLHYCMCLEVTAPPNGTCAS